MTIALAGNIARTTDVLSSAGVWTPTWANLTKGTSPTEDYWYEQAGDWVLGGGMIVLGTSPSASASVYFTLPVTAYAGGSTNDQSLGAWMFRDNSATTWYAGTLSTYDSGGTQARMVGAWDGTAPRSAVGASGTTPVSLGTGDKISFQFAYRAA